MVAHQFYGAASLWGRVGSAITHILLQQQLPLVQPSFLIADPGSIPRQPLSSPSALVHCTQRSQRSGWSLHSKSHCSETFPLSQKEGFRSPSAGRCWPRGLPLGTFCVSAAQGPSFRSAVAGCRCPFHAGSPPPRRAGGKPGKRGGRIVRLVLRKILLSSAVRCAEFPLPCCFFSSSERVRDFHI